MYLGIRRAKRFLSPSLIRFQTLYLHTACKKSPLSISALVITLPLLYYTMTAEVNSGLTYVITNVKSGTVMDLSANDHRSITGWPPNGGHNQQWTMNWTGNSWNFISKATGQYLNILGSPADGILLIASNEPFDWHIWRDEDDPNTFRIFVPFTYENLDLYGDGEDTPGTPITLWNSWRGALHQTWLFTQV